MATPTRIPFELVGSDGEPLRGEVRTTPAGGARPTVVICHGFKGFMRWGFFPHLADRCARAGFTAVSFNFSGSGVGPDGESFTELERFGHATHAGDVADIGIVVTALRDGALGGVPSPSRVGVVAHSRGGGAAVLYAASHDLDALVTWNSIANIDRWPEDVLNEWRTHGKIEVVNARTGQVLPLYHDLLDEVEHRARGDLNILAAAGRVSAPWLIIHGDADEAVPVVDGIRLSDAAKSGGVKQLRIIGGGSHTFGAKHPWAGSTPELDTAFDETIDWLSRHLL